ncbi:hypothetical protein C7M84_014763 [Penaeus vannamei]|uniref:Uncharacterized protein n=1 Tax=Penaeus vannamei TaxID=6689 RepID=A0A3R7M4S5_PENVA|nr:hypothetical protein C7M84_014763 [Penaeus vannamei]
MSVFLIGHVATHLDVYIQKAVFFWEYCHGCYHLCLPNLHHSKCSVWFNHHNPSCFLAGFSCSAGFSSQDSPAPQASPRRILLLRRSQGSAGFSSQELRTAPQASSQDSPAPQANSPPLNFLAPRASPHGDHVFSSPFLMHRPPQRWLHMGGVLVILPGWELPRGGLLPALRLHTGVLSAQVPGWELPGGAYLGGDILGGTSTCSEAEYLRPSPIGDTPWWELPGGGLSRGDILGGTSTCSEAEYLRPSPIGCLWRYSCGDSSLGGDYLGGDSLGGPAPLFYSRVDDAEPDDQRWNAYSTPPTTPSPTHKLSRSRARPRALKAPMPSKALWRSHVYRSINPMVTCLSEADIKRNRHVGPWKSSKALTGFDRNKKAPFWALFSISSSRF